MRPHPIQATIHSSTSEPRICFDSHRACGIATCHERASARYLRPSDCIRRGRSYTEERCLFTRCSFLRKQVPGLETEQGTRHSRSEEFHKHLGNFDRLFVLEPV